MLQRMGIPMRREDKSHNYGSQSPRFIPNGQKLRANSGVLLLLPVGHKIWELQHFIFVNIL